MKIKKIVMSVVGSVLAVAMAFGFAACGGEGGGNEKTALTAPEISLTDKVISWTAVEHATGYEVFENNSSVATVETTTYTITQTETGEYAYTVRALCSTGEYEASALSNSVTYVVEASIKPSAPVISIDDTGKITWAAVDGAVSYDIYEDGEIIGNTADSYYTIGAGNPGVHSYTVVAVGATENSEPSNAVEFEVLMSVIVSVQFPEDYPETAKVTVKVYEEATEKESAEVSREKDSVYGIAQFNLKSGEYVAQIDEVESGYVATRAYISATSANYMITIIKSTADNTIGVGEVSVTVTDEDAGHKTLVFTAEKEGKYSIIADENNAYEIMLNDRSLVNSSGLNIGTFSVSAGETVIFDFFGVTGEYKFTLQEGEVKQYLVISPYYVLEDQDKHPEVHANMLTESCTRYLNVEKADTYTFFFPMASLGTRTVKLTINNKTYEFSGADTTLINIELTEGEDIEVTVVIEGAPSGFGYPALFIYPYVPEEA